MVQVLVAGLLALVVSVTGLALLAIAQAFVSALNSRHFTRLLLEQDLAVAAPRGQPRGGLGHLLPDGALRDGGEGARGGRPKLVWMGVLCALAILGYQMLHLYFWYGGGPSTCGTIFLDSRSVGNLRYEQAAQEFSRYYNLVSILTNTAIGFLSIACFLPDRPSRGGRVTERHGQTTVPAAGLLLRRYCWPRPRPPPSARSLSGDGDAPRHILVGFRADAPPFSSIKRVGGRRSATKAISSISATGSRARPERALPDGQDPGHRGGPLRPPRASEGERWRPGEPTADAKVDLLCDPVTLRYASESDEPVGARRTDGIFSPIVFVTGFPMSSAARAAPARRCSGSSAGRRRARWRCRPASATPSASGRAWHPVRRASNRGVRRRPEAGGGFSFERNAQGAKPSRRARLGLPHRRRPDPAEDRRIPLLPLRQPHRGRGVVLQGERARPSTTSATRI